MKTKEIKEMTRKERKALLLMKFNYHKLSYVWNILNNKKYETDFEKNEMILTFNLLKNFYFMEHGEEMETYMVLRM